MEEPLDNRNCGPRLGRIQDKIQRHTRINYILDHQYVFAFDIDIEVLGYLDRGVALI